MQSQPPKSTNWLVWGAIALAVLCLCVVVLALVGVAAYLVTNNTNVTPSLPLTEATVGPPVSLNRPPLDSISTETAGLLSAATIPENDPYGLACRLQDLCNVPDTLPAPARPYAVGDTRKFWITNNDTIENFQIDAVLRYVTPHSYFWVEDGIDARDDDISALMNAFEDKIYPTDRKFFGSEWMPGVDNDPHVYIVYAGNVGANTGGYYSPFDEYNPLVRKYSNGVELFVFNADGTPLHDEYAYGTLAHEFQHMIHWNLDRNEGSPINEGFAELASFLNGYTVGGSDWAYAVDPDLPLDDWTSLSDAPDVTVRHYGQAFLFTAYFLDRFGDQATQDLVKHQENGLASVALTLKELNITDALTGKPVTLEDLVLDWMAAMYLGDSTIGDGRYAFNNYSDAPRASAGKTIDSCPSSQQGASVSQFGPDYIAIDCAGDHTLEFTGSTAVGVLPADAHSGSYAFWSNKGDTSDMTLTREFDFSAVTGSIDLNYWTWYDIEKGWDYLYLEASTDGEHWKIIKTPSCTEEDLSGNSYGCGYTGESGGGSKAAWIKESVDLSDFAGKTVQIRFEYVTDTAVNGEGLLLDDVAVEAVNYHEDFESGDGGWQPEGFVRMESELFQTYALELILIGNQGTTVERIAVREDQTATIPFSLQTGEKAVLVVTGTQILTRLPSTYAIEVK